MQIRKEQVKLASEGQVFNSKKELYEFFIQEQVPGGRNAQLALEEIKRYMELEQIDKRKVRIKKIKLWPDDKKKKSGGAHNVRYITHTKILIKSLNNFTLSNKQIFEEILWYGSEQINDFMKQAKSDEQEALEKIYTTLQYPIKVKPLMQYNAILMCKVYSIIESTLKSLKREGVIKWEKVNMTVGYDSSYALRYVEQIDILNYKCVNWETLTANEFAEMTYFNKEKTNRFKECILEYHDEIIKKKKNGDSEVLFFDLIKYLLQDNYETSYFTKYVGISKPERGEPRELNPKEEILHKSLQQAIHKYLGTTAYKVLVDSNVSEKYHAFYSMVNQILGIKNIWKTNKVVFIDKNHIPLERQQEIAWKVFMYELKSFMEEKIIKTKFNPHEDEIKKSKKGIVVPFEDLDVIREDIDYYYLDKSIVWRYHNILFKTADIDYDNDCDIEISTIYEKTKKTDLTVESRLMDLKENGFDLKRNIKAKERKDKELTYDDLTFYDIMER